MGMNKKKHILPLKKEAANMFEEIIKAIYNILATN